MNRSKLLENFSVLKAFHENSKDILEALLPFIEYAIVEIDKKHIRIMEIKDKINSDCQIDIPISTLQTLLNKLKRLGKIKTLEDSKIIEVLETTRSNDSHYKELFEDSQCKISSFVEDFKLKYNHTDKNNDEILYALYDFIDLYKKFIGSNELSKDMNYELADKLLLADMAEHIKYIQLYDNKNYCTFKNIFHGYLLCNIVKRGDVGLENRKLTRITVYVDSNYMFRLLNLQNPFYYIASKELFEMLKEAGVSIMIFSDVVDEMRRALSNKLEQFASEKIDVHSPMIKSNYDIDGMIGSFIRNKWDRTKIGEYIDNIEEEIRMCGVQIQKNKLPNASSNYADLYNKLYDNKMDKIKLGINNPMYERLERVCTQKISLDVKIVSYIAYLRREKRYRFEDCKALFLSCDTNLTSTVKRLSEGCVPECFSEEALTNILFMYNPKTESEASIKFLIGIFESSRYVDYDVLKNFSVYLQEYSDANPEDDKYIGFIFKNRSLNDKLSKIEPEEIVHNGKTVFEGIIEEMIVEGKKYVDLIEIEKEAADKRCEELEKQNEALLAQLSSADDLNQSKDIIVETIMEDATQDGKSATEDKIKAVKIIKMIYAMFMIVLALACSTVIYLTCDDILTKTDLLIAWGKWLIPLYVLTILVLSLRRGKDSVVEIIINNLLNSNRAFRIENTKILLNLLFQSLLPLIGSLVIPFVVECFTASFSSLPK